MSKADYSEPVPNFSLNRGSQELFSVELGTRHPVGAPVSVLELDRCSMKLEPVEQSVEYRVRIGDLTPPDNYAIGSVFESRSLWPAFSYFESARGETPLQLWSRDCEIQDAWRLRLELLVIVSPSKVSELQYQQMFNELNFLAQGITYDLLSKSRSAFESAPETPRRVRSSLVELSLLRRLWQQLIGPMHSVSSRPASGLRLTSRTAPVWSIRGFGTREFADLARLGVDPRRERGGRLRIRSRCLVETVDLPEHRRVLSLLQFLRKRAAECREDAEAMIKALEQDRDLFLGAAGKSWEKKFNEIHLPRLDRLEEALEATDALIRDLDRAIHMPLFRGLVPEAGTDWTPILRHVSPYRKIWSAFRIYLERGGISLDHGGKERVKPTWKIYEQWVFLQLASALRTAGLTCESQIGMLGRQSRYRFTLDLDHDSSVVFSSPNGDRWILRYVPWILSRADAIKRGDTVYRAREEEAPWQPDVLLEFHRASHDESSLSLSYAIVVDAKYSRNLTPEKFDRVSKYLEIRSVETDKPITRQVWLSKPDPTIGIELNDAAIRWSENGPDRPTSEHMVGTLGIAPPAYIKGSLELNAYLEADVPSPVPIAVEFASGIVRYLTNTPVDAD